MESSSTSNVTTVDLEFSLRFEKIQFYLFSSETLRLPFIILNYLWNLVVQILVWQGYLGPGLNKQQDTKDSKDQSITVRGNESRGFNKPSLQRKFSFLSKLVVGVDLC